MSLARNYTETDMSHLIGPRTGGLPERGQALIYMGPDNTATLFSTYYTGRVVGHYLGSSKQGGNGSINNLCFQCVRKLTIGLKAPG